MKKIAVAFASAGLLALAACGEKPAQEANNAAVENVVDNVSNATEDTSNASNASNAVDNTSNAVENTTAHAE